MSELEPEQIGTMRFLPNPDYPYPLKVAVPPYFWMEEQTGVLAPAVAAYMNGDLLDEAQLDLLRQYLRQYVERAVLTGAANRNLLLAHLPKLRTIAAVERFAEELAEWGIEPF